MLSQSQKDKYYMIPLISVKCIETESRMRLPGGENEALLFHGDRVSVLQDEKL